MVRDGVRVEGDVDRWERVIDCYRERREKRFSAEKLDEERDRGEIF